jgi:transcriptional adapter 2-alpha
MAGDKMRNKEEREIMHLLRPFQQFSSKEDHEQLVRGCVDEHRIRKRIEQLKGYLAEGLKTKADIEAYEAKKRRKE